MVQIVFAPDGVDLNRAVDLCKAIKGSQWGPSLRWVKIHSLYDAHGPASITPFANMGLDPWVDAKLKDVSSTVSMRAAALRSAGAKAITVHASGEVDMMLAAKKPGLVVYAVTALTSLEPWQIELAHGVSPIATVIYLARLSKLAGMDGVVCSAVEVGELKKRPELSGMELIVPGTRSAGVALGAQRRSDTPSVAVDAGATQLVVASEVVGDTDPVAAFGRFVEAAEAA